MKCPKCGKDVELQNRQAGVDENGKPIFNEYAICRDCKKQWNLDKQKAKKAANTNASNHIQSKEKVHVKTEDVKGLRPVPSGPADKQDQAVKKDQADKSQINKMVNTPRSNKSQTDKNQDSREGIRSGVKKSVPGPASVTENQVPAGQKTVARAAGSVRNPETPGRITAPVTKAQGVGAEPAAPVRNKASANKNGSVSSKNNSNSSSVSPNKKAAADIHPRRLNKKAEAGKPSEAYESQETSTKAPSVTRPASPARRAASQKNHVADPESAKNVSGSSPAPKRRANPVDTGCAKQETKEKGQRYGNIPPEKVRVKREKAVKNNYDDMLAADPNKRPVKKKRPASDEQTVSGRGPASASGSQKKKGTSAQPAKKSPVIKEEPKPKFYMPRIILGIISIIAFAFFAYKGFLAGLNNISSGKESMAGTVYIALALCMLVSGLLLLIMRKKHTIFAFVLPMIFYIGGAVFAFFKRADDGFLLYGAIASAVLAVIFIVLTIVSISGNGDDYDDYDDPFEDGFEDDFKDD